MNLLYIIAIFILSFVAKVLPKHSSNYFQSNTNNNLGSKEKMYKNVLKKLYKYNQINPVKLGLSNSLKLYELLGNPLNNVPIVHVGGTNVILFIMII